MRINIYFSNILCVLTMYKDFLLIRKECMGGYFIDN